MTILFINIFTGISIDELQGLIQHSESEIVSRKINYVLKVESYFKKIHILIGIDLLEKINLCFEFILKLFKFFEKVSICIPSFIIDYFKNCWDKYNKKGVRKKNKEVVLINELEKNIKNQINESKLIINSKFESNDKNMKKNIEALHKDIDEKLYKLLKKD